MKVREKELQRQITRLRKPRVSHGTNTQRDAERADAAERIGAMLALRRFHEQVEPGTISLAVSELAAVLRNGSNVLRMRAMEALAAIGPKAQQAQYELASLVDDRWQFTRAKALETLWKIGASPEVVVLPAVSHIEDTSSEVRKNAHMLLVVRLGAKAVPAFRAILRSSTEVKDRRAAALGLSNLPNSLAEECVTAVCDALADTAPEVREAAVHALANIAVQISDQKLRRVIERMLSFHGIREPHLRIREALSVQIDRLRTASQSTPGQMGFGVLAA